MTRNKGVKSWVARSVSAQPMMGRVAQRGRAHNAGVCRSAAASCIPFWVGWERPPSATAAGRRSNVERYERKVGEEGLNYCPEGVWGERGFGRQQVATIDWEGGWIPPCWWLAGWRERENK